jgi:uncharacterized protein (TIGR04255 family)
MVSILPKLKTAPIVEAIFDIDCSLASGFDVASLETRAKELYGDKYPDLQKQLRQEFKIETGDTSAQATVTPAAVQALQFRSQDGKQIVQVRAQGFSFNRLAPYTTLDDYLPEIERTWLLYVDLASPLQTRIVRLRYINRILVPLTGDNFDLDDYFNIGPRPPDEKRLLQTGFFVRQTAVEPDTGIEASWVLTPQPVAGDKVPILFDITVGRGVAGEPRNLAEIRAAINALRALKNRIFGNSLTAKCIDLFQQ